MLGFSIYRDVAANFLLLVILVNEERKKGHSVSACNE